MSLSEKDAKRIAAVMADGDGWWRTCSGCHESEDGHDVGRYPFSKTFACKLGGGCGECGGLGAVWNATDVDFGNFLASEAASPSPALAEATLAELAARVRNAQTLLGSLPHEGCARGDAHRKGMIDAYIVVLEGIASVREDILSDQAAREEASQGAGEPAKGWLYHCPDTGTEWSDNHPIESGEVPDAKDVRPSTLDALHAELMAAWEVLAERPSPPNPQARIEALEGAVNKAIRILSDHKLGEPRRVLDARDVLIIARSALNRGADHD